MTGKHPTDHIKESDDQRAEEYTRIERETGNPSESPKVKAMHRNREQGETERLERFLEIERRKGD